MNQTISKFTGGRLAGKVAMIIGAGSVPGSTGVSNGYAAAKVFASEGARIFAVDVDQAALSHTSDAVLADGGVIRSAIADVRNVEQVQAAVAQCVEAYGAIDVLHNNVGVGSTGGIVTIPDEEWTRVLDTNLVGIRNTCRAVLPIMEKARRGSIINVSSLLASRALRRIPNVA